MHPRFRTHHGFRLLLAAALLLFIGSTVHRPVAHADGSFRPRDEIRRTLLNQEGVHLIDAPTLQLSQVAADEIVQGTAAVTFAPDVSAPQAEERIRSIDGNVLSSVPRLNVYEVQLREGLAVEQGIVSLSALPGAVRAEPLVRLQADLHPNDPLYDTYQAPYLKQLHAEQAWDLQLGDPGIVVAVLDSGVDLTHPDLRNQIWTNPKAGRSGCGNDLHGCNFVDPRKVDPSCSSQDTTAVPNPDVQAYPSGKLAFHGTFVSGVIAAGINNGAGIAGVAPRVSIMPVRVGDCTAPYDTAIANGLLYAADNGARVINLSLGGSCRPWPSFLLDAIAQVQAAGAIVVAAAGNEGRPCVGSPANVAGVVGVGSTDATGLARAGFSNWGPEIAVVAPGVGIVSSVPYRRERVPNDYYMLDSGTSFSTPIVSGLAALLLSQNSVLTPAWIRYLIQAGSTPLAAAGQPGWDGAGRIDLLSSLLLVPAAIYGRVTRGGRNVPDESSVQAFVGDALCGEGATRSDNGDSVYILFVSTAATQSGCGVPGALVTITVDGQPAATAAFQSAAVPLDLPVGD